MLTVGKMYAMSIFELLAAMQACMIYLIMYIIDYSPEDEENARELLLALHASPTVCSCFLWLTLIGALCGVQKVRRWMFRTE